MLLLVIVGVVAALIAFSLLRKPRTRGKAQNLAALKKRYLAMVQMPPAVAQQTLDRVLEDMKRQYPNRTARWHLQRMIQDLQRDRR